MQYLLCCEIKKLICNRAFIKLALFLIIANVVACFFVPTNNGLMEREIEGYSRYIEEICTQSEFIQNSPLYKDDDYSVQVAEKTKSIYEKLKDVHLVSINSTGTEDSFSASSSFL